MNILIPIPRLPRALSARHGGQANPPESARPMLRTIVSGAARMLIAIIIYAIPCATEGGAGADTKSAPDLLQTLAAALRNYEGVQDYTVEFHKQQRVGGVLYPEEQMLLKFKKPFMVYMKWTGTIDRGREALYVTGQHGGRVLVHLGGVVNYFAPSFLLHPTGVLAMRKNLRPITRSGLESTIMLLKEMCEKAKERGDLEVRYRGAGECAGRPTHRFERILPAGKGYPAHRTLLELDRESGFPLSVESYGWDGELHEKYLYKDLRTNVGLTEKDFDRGNTQYGFGYVTVPIP